MQPRTAPSGAPREAERAVEHDLGLASVARFRDVRAHEVAVVRRSPFEEPIDGPVSVVCGEFSVPAKAGGYSPYSWFFVAIKNRRLLWTTLDKDPASPGEAYYSCKGAGLTNDGPPESLPDD